jgi:hypothetical protein
MEISILDNINKKKIAYNAAYTAKNYQKLSANIKPEDYALIDNYCKDTNISKAKFIVKCCKYCIDHDINFND